MSALERAEARLAGRVSRRSFLGRLGGWLVALAGGQLAAVALDPERSEAFHICGHIWTTGSCPHPFSPNSRIDGRGFPLHPRFGYPVDDHGKMYLSHDQPRHRICQHRVRDRFRFTGHTVLQGSWSRCCHGRIRRVRDCCSYSATRINGDAALTGYCFNGRKVFCIVYEDTKIRC